MSRVTDIHDVLHWANRTALAQEITRRGYRVSGETLNRWYRQRSEVPAVVERIVFELFGTQRNAAPDYGERLDRIEGLARAIATAIPGVRLEEVERVAAELEPLVQPPVESRQTEGSRTRDESVA
jgi:hypothetical protein